MKSPYENRLFCGVVSLACSWFIYTDFRDNHKINILNLIMFLCTTYLALYKKKIDAETTILPENKKTISLDKKTDISEFDEEKELQLSKTFRKS